jgi:hypothetical protein
MTPEEIEAANQRVEKFNKAFLDNIMVVLQHVLANPNATLPDTLQWTGDDSRGGMHPQHIVDTVTRWRGLGMDDDKIIVNFQKMLSFRGPPPQPPAS